MRQVLPRRPTRSTFRRRVGARGRCEAAWSLGGAALCAVLGCSRPTEVAWLRTPAVGRSSLCRERVRNLSGDLHQPTADEVRCSYRNPRGDHVRVAGQVLRAPGPGQALGLATAVSGVEVALRPVVAGDELGPAVAQGRSDTQGSFTLDGLARPGTYVVVAGAGRSQPLELGAPGSETVGDVRVLLPSL